MRRLVVLIALVGCGRVNFDPRGDATVIMTTSVGGNTGAQLGTTTADTYIAECTPTFEFGGSSHMHVKDGTTCPADGRIVGLMRFDLSAVPASAQITSAVLRISSHGNTMLVATHELHRILEAWDEGTSDDNGLPGVANWTQRQVGVAWTAAGCGAGSCDPAVMGTYVSMTAPDQLIELNLDMSVVQGWVDGSLENHGFAIKAPGTSMMASALNTRDYADGLRPELVLSYAP